MLRTERYVGIPFADHGRSESGVDCWGLVRQVYRNELNVELPSYDNEYESSLDGASISEIIMREAREWSGVRFGEETEGDVIVLKIAGLETHVGVVVERGVMLHCERRLHGVQIERYDGVVWKHRVVGIYRRVRQGEVVVSEIVDRGQAMFSVRCCPSPVSLRVIEGAAPEGGTVKDVVTAFGPHGLALDARVYVDDVAVPRESWDAVRPRAGQLVTVRVIPAGGESGKQNLKVILSLLVVAAAVYTGQWWAAHMIGGSFVGALVTGGMTLAGYSMLNSMFPILPPKLASSVAETPMYQITGVRNVANPYGAVPRVYGEMRIFPPLAAAPYIENSGSDTYLRMLFCAGYGPLELDEFRIGETDAHNYDIQIEWLAGDEVAPHLNYYPTVVHEESFSILFSTSYETVTSHADTEEVLVDFTFPYGLWQTGPNGREARSITLYAQYREHGTSDPWMPSDADENLAVAFSASNYNFEGDAHYDSGTGEVHIGQSGGYGKVTSKYVFVGYPIGIKFGATLYSASVNRMVGFEIKFYRGLLEPTTNDEGYSGYSLDEPIASGSTWTPRLEEVTGGERVEVVVWSIDNGSVDKCNLRIKDPMLRRFEGFTITANTVTQLRKVIRWKFDEAKQWDIRFKRELADTSGSGDNHMDTVYLTRVLSMKNEFPVQLDGMSLIAVRVKATGQLNGTLDTFNCRARSLLRSWNGSSWNAAAITSNPAWIFCDILQGAATRHPLADSKIDLAKILLFAAHCASGNMMFNGSIDSRTTIYEALRMVASVGRGDLMVLDGKFCVVMDKVNTGEATAPVFTGRNSMDLKIERTFYSAPHGVRVKFINKDSGYVEDMCVVYSTGYSEANATVFEEIELFGVTSYTQAYRAGLFRLGELIYRRERISLKVDVESLTVTRGDLVRVQNDAAMWGICAMRITAWSKVGTDLTFTFDEYFTMEDGKSYQFVLRYENGNFLTASAPTIVGTWNQITISGWSTPPLPNPEVGDLMVFGETNMVLIPCLVKSIEYDRDHQAELSLVRYDSDLYTATDAASIPEFESGITKPPVERRVPNTPAIVRVRSDETVMFRDSSGTVMSRIMLDVEIPAGGQVAATYVQAQYRESGSGQRWLPMPPVPSDTRELSVFPVSDGVAYDVRVWSISEFGRTSEWAQIDAHIVIGKSTLPPDVPCLYMELQSFLAWKYSDAPIDLLGFKVRMNEGTSTSWATGQPLTDTAIAETRFSIGTVSGGIKTFMVKAVDVAGNESANAISLTVDTGDPDEENVVWEEDKKADGFKGIVVGGSVVSGNLEASTGDLFWVEESESMWLEDADGFWTAHYSMMSFEFFGKPAKEWLPCRVWLDLTVDELREITYRVIRAYFSELFDGSLTTNWDTPAEGTWTIVAGELQAQHAAGGSWHQYLVCKTLRPANGVKAHIEVRLKSDDISHQNIGVWLCGYIFQFQGTQHYITATATTNNPTWADNVWHVWHFEILADLTINWYVNGEWIGSTSFTSTDRTFKLDCEQPNTPPHTAYFDDVQMWEEGSEWRPWLGEVQLTDAADLAELEVFTIEGGTQGKITELTVECDVPSVVERFENVSISSGGTRLSLTKSYRSIKTVIATVLDDGGTGMYAKAMDRDAASGPLMKVFDSSGTAVNGKISADVEGT